MMGAEGGGGGGGGQHLWGTSGNAVLLDARLPPQEDLASAVSLRFA